ncbi:hypothetical protein AGMMS50267_18490 [Spirochaetia bacterium]|nr:hypothetical protein AGMMS50267_18490 [Spirochaetia bacterium]
MRYKAPFTLFKRKLGSGKAVWYYQVYDENGRRRQYSTGTDTKTAARIVCFDLYRKNNLIQKPVQTFANYTADWFIYDKCPYVKYRLLRVCESQAIMSPLRTTRENVTPRGSLGG